MLLSVQQALQHWRVRRRPLSITGHVSLPEELRISEASLVPRGKEIEGRHYSFMHTRPHETLPHQLLTLIQENWKVVSWALGFHEIVMRPADFYRTVAVPRSVLEKQDGEIFSNAWHRDTTGIPNVQIFILLQDTYSDMGPLQYVSATNHSDLKKQFPEVYEKAKRSTNMSIPESFCDEFTGKRGDFLVLNTSCQLHRASISKSTFPRDMISLVFEPKSLCDIPKSLQLTYDSLNGLLQNR